MARGKDIGFDRTVRTPAGGVGTQPPEAERAEGPKVRLPAEFIPPRGAQYFTIQDERDTAIIEQIVFANPFDAPQGNDIVINTVQFYASNADPATLDMSFQLLVGGNPYAGFEAIKVPALGGAQGVVFSPVYVPIFSGGGIRIAGKFLNINGGAHRVGTLIQGWFMPAKL